MPDDLFYLLLSSLNYQPQHFRSIYETERGAALWRFLVRGDNVLRMETASDLGRVAVEPLEADLLATFGDFVKEDRVKQFIGHAVRQIMEWRGFSHEKANVRLFRGMLFKSASRYHRNSEGAKLAISPQALDRMPGDEHIIARRVALEEFSEYIGGLDYLNGRILTKSGVELFVGVKEFAEFIKALGEEREKKNTQGGGE
jgi:hypothetical protein